MDKKDLMRRAIQLSDESVEKGGGPFGAVIARNGEIVAEGSNRKRYRIFLKMMYFIKICCKVTK